MTRDFMEERRLQLIQEELNKIMERMLGPRGTELRDNIEAIYGQNPLLKFMLGKDARSTRN